MTGTPKRQTSRELFNVEVGVFQQRVAVDVEDGAVFVGHEQAGGAR